MIVQVILVWNLLVFCLYAADKYFAIAQKRRIPEKHLTICTLLLGGAGAALGMALCRHKTRKLKFRVTVIIGLGILTLFWVYISSLF